MKTLIAINVTILFRNELKVRATNSETLKILDKIH
jgi:hypothetical protein